MTIGQCHQQNHDPIYAQNKEKRGQYASLFDSCHDLEGFRQFITTNDLCGEVRIRYSEITMYFQKYFALLANNYHQQ